MRFASAKAAGQKDARQSALPRKGEPAVYYHAKQKIAYLLGAPALAATAHTAVPPEYVLCVVVPAQCNLSHVHKRDLFRRQQRFVVWYSKYGVYESPALRRLPAARSPRGLQKGCAALRGILLAVLRETRRLCAGGACTLRPAPAAPLVPKRKRRLPESSASPSDAEDAPAAEKGARSAPPDASSEEVLSEIDALQGMRTCTAGLAKALESARALAESAQFAGSSKTAWDALHGAAHSLQAEAQRRCWSGILRDAVQGIHHCLPGASAQLSATSTLSPADAVRLPHPPFARAPGWFVIVEGAKSITLNLRSVRPAPRRQASGGPPAARALLLRAFYNDLCGANNPNIEISLRNLPAGGPVALSLELRLGRAQSFPARALLLPGGLPEGVHVANLALVAPLVTEHSLLMACNASCTKAVQEALVPADGADAQAFYAADVPGCIEITYSTWVFVARMLLLHALAAADAALAARTADQVLNPEVPPASLAGLQSARPALKAAVLVVHPTAIANGANPAFDDAIRALGPSTACTAAWFRGFGAVLRAARRSSSGSAEARPFVLGAHKICAFLEATHTAYPRLERAYFYLLEEDLFADEALPEGAAGADGLGAGAKEARQRRWLGKINRLMHGIARAGRRHAVFPVLALLCVAIAGPGYNPMASEMPALDEWALHWREERGFARGAQVVYVFPNSVHTYAD